MRRLLPNVLLLLMLVFLLPVYLVEQRTDLLGLGVLLLAAAFFVVYTNQPRALAIVGGMTLVLSIVGMAYWGRLLAGSNGAYCLVGLWIVGLFALAVLMFRRAVVVRRGQIVVINQLPENRAVILSEGLHWMLRPFVERRMAALPSYELDFNQMIPNLYTRSLATIDELKLMVRYRIAEPRDTVFNFPNREQAFANLAAERRPPEARDTDGQVAFWSELIRRQMEVEVDQAVRIVIPAADSPAAIATERESIAREVRKRLQTSTARWGVEVLELRLLDVVVAPEQLRSSNDSRSGVPRDEQSRTENRASATARMVGEMVRTLQQQGKPLGADEIERIVLTAMRQVEGQ
jgi:regulator of protease activity HflC (stomatin/prohibitin superfamily)